MPKKQEIHPGVCSHLRAQLEIIQERIDGARTINKPGCACTFEGHFDPAHPEQGIKWSGWCDVDKKAFKE